MKLEADFGAPYGSLLELVEEVRSQLREKKLKVRVETWQKALDLDRLIDFVREGRTKEAKKMLVRELKA